MALEAREVARKALKEHEVPPLPADVLRKGAALVKGYEAKTAH
jgi:trimethylamine:corrinoid methyltransferase-like protein